MTKKKSTKRQVEETDSGHPESSEDTSKDTSTPSVKQAISDLRKALLRSQSGLSPQEEKERKTPIRGRLKGLDLEQSEPQAEKPSVKVQIQFDVPGEATIAGDRNSEDVRCPYCDSPDACPHLMVFLDPLNYNLGGEFYELDKIFIDRIEKIFLPYLEQEGSNPKWKSEEITELWAWAQEDWSQKYREVEIESIALFRLISNISGNAAEHEEWGSQIEGMGIETEYSYFYDDDSQRFLARALSSLDAMLATIN